MDGGEKDKEAFACLPSVATTPSAYVAVLGASPLFCCRSDLQVTKQHVERAGCDHCAEEGEAGGYVIVHRRGYDNITIGTLFILPTTSCGNWRTSLVDKVLK